MRDLAGEKCQRRLLPAHQNDLCQGDHLRVCDRQERRSPAHGLEAATGPVVEHETWWSPGANDFDVAPPDLVREPGPQRLHGRFLCSESPGEVNGRPMTSLTICDLAAGEYSAHETRSPAFDDVLDAVDIG